jgi:molybdate transport system substrate-binding protein
MVRPFRDLSILAEKPKKCDLSRPNKVPTPSIVGCDISQDRQDAACLIHLADAIVQPSRQPHFPSSVQQEDRTDTWRFMTTLRVAVPDGNGVKKSRHSSGKAFLTSLLLVCSCAGQGIPADKDDVMVFAAASTTDCIQSLAKAYEQSSHNHIICNFSNSATLAKQIEEGASADIFLSADQKWMDYLSEHHAIIAESRSDLLGNELAFITPSRLTLSIKAEKGSGNTPAFSGRMAIGEPTSVPAGIYAKQSLIGLDWWDSLSDRLAPAADVRAVLRLVELDEVDLGIVYATDAKASTKIHVSAIIPSAMHDPILYPIALTTSARPNSAAFLAYLHSPEAQLVFTTAGFTVLPPTAAHAK